MISYTKNCQAIDTTFVKHMVSKFSIPKVSKNLQNWSNLTFGEFLKELKKHKVKLSLSEEAEWMEYFNAQKDQLTSIREEIERTDREIDAMVYELYGLTASEIELVQGVTTP